MFKINERVKLKDDKKDWIVVAQSRHNIIIGCPGGDERVVPMNIAAEVLQLAPNFYGQHYTCRPGLYLGLFNGYTSEEAREEADGLPGERGPVIGPLKYVHTTYLWRVAFEFVDRNAAQLFRDLVFSAEINGDQHNIWEGELLLVDDCLLYQDMLYGDWNVFNIRPEDTTWTE